MPDIRWVTTPEVATRLGVTVGHVGKLIRTGRLPAQRAGATLYRVREDHLADFQADLQRSSCSPSGQDGQDGQASAPEQIESGARPPRPAQAPRRNCDRPALTPADAVIADLAAVLGGEGLGGEGRPDG